MSPKVRTAAGTNAGEDRRARRKPQSHVLELMTPTPAKLASFALLGLLVLQLGVLRQFNATYWGDLLLVAIAIVGTSSALYFATSSSRKREIDNLKSSLSIEHRNAVADQACLLWINGQFPGALTPFSAYSITPQNLSGLLALVAQQRPRLVVELGSGASTSLIAACLKRNGVGRLISFDHEPWYSAQCKQHLTERGLADVAEVREVPLKPQVVAGNEVDWYDLEGHLNHSEKIDLLVIDGPPAKEDTKARLPALILLEPYLSDRAHVFLDDGDRPGERSAVDVWLQMFPGFSATSFSSSTGYWILRRTSNLRPTTRL